MGNKAEQRRCDQDIGRKYTTEGSYYRFLDIFALSYDSRVRRPVPDSLVLNTSHRRLEECHYGVISREVK